jgi:integrase
MPETRKKISQPLTKKDVAKLVTAGERGRWLDERGLYLQVLGPKNSSWILRYERGTKIASKGNKAGQIVPNGHWMGLGSARDFDLHEARDRARNARQLLADGIDPLEQKRAVKRAAVIEQARQEARAVTFKQAAMAYFEAHEKKWKNDKHRDQFLSSLRLHAFDLIGALPVADIDKVLVLSVLNPIWPTIPETANRVRGRIETVLNYAGANGWRDPSVLNPARWRGFLDQLFMPKTKVKKPGHHKALNWRDMPQFMTDLRARPGVAAAALQFTILTAARTSEVTGARWEEIDLEAAVWTVPGERMKKGREHRVPLSKPAVALLRDARRVPQHGENPFVFVGPRKGGLSNMAMDAILRRMKVKDVATVHGMRSAFRDWADEETNFPRQIAELALAHVNKDKVEAAYLRTDLLTKRRKLMETWAQYCNRPSATPSQVVNFKRTA